MLRWWQRLHLCVSESSTNQTKDGVRRRCGREAVLQANRSTSSCPPECRWTRSEQLLEQLLISTAKLINVKCPRGLPRLHSTMPRRDDQYVLDLIAKQLEVREPRVQTTPAKHLHILHGLEANQWANDLGGRGEDGSHTSLSRKTTAESQRGDS